LSLGFPRKPLDLREGFFDGAEVRRVGPQVQQLSSSFLDQLFGPLALASRSWRALRFKKGKTNTPSKFFGNSSPPAQMEI
jgi:hypothetical protein